MVNRAKQIVLLFLCLFFSLATTLTASNPWTEVREDDFIKRGMNRQIIPHKYLTYALDIDELQEILSQAPMRFSPESYGAPVVLQLPMPNGQMERFQIFDAPIMHPDLAAKYPLIHSYAGVGLDDKTASLRFDVTQFGFHAMVLSGQHNAVFIDPFSKDDTKHYISYYKKDFHKETHFECHYKGDADMATVDDVSVASSVQGDCMFRTYRLALACTGEYATFHGGNKPDVMAAFNTSMTRVNGIYERDVAVTMVLVPNTDTLIFLDGNTDPYANQNGGTMLGQNQTTCDDLIGTANYDIGHVFSTGGGGIASLNAPCNAGNKAQGVTGLGSPVGDPFDVDYVAHEMGHQYGANHTQNNPCNRNSSTAMEPGSASTIMGYAGICAPNVQNNSDAYFHAISLQEITQNIVNGSGGNCPVLTDPGNTPPTVDGGNANYTLPISTPFKLTAVGNDLDGDSLTYCWEQMDNETAPHPPESTSTGGPAFRTYDPVPDPHRYFPKIGDIVNGIDDDWEELPSVARDMNFRVTVRDNAMGAGCTEEDDVELTFEGTAGPFLVQEPNTSVTWFGGEIKTILWDVANTDVAPVSCANVDILLSLDGGFTYPIVLDTNVPNDGSHDISVPLGSSTDMARVMVFCSDNIFFDISDENFVIEAPTVPTFVGSVDPASHEVCGTVESVVYNFSYLSLVGFNEEVTLAATGAPAGATVTFSQDVFTPSAMITLTVGNLGNVASGTYTINVVGTSASVTLAREIVLEVTNGLPEVAILTSPVDGATGQSLVAELTWDEVNNASEYFIEIATNPSFGNSIIESSSVTTNSYTPSNLDPLTVYYWRIRSSNICGEGDNAALFSFQTGGEGCNTYSSTDTPVTIPEQISTVASTIPVGDNLIISDVNVSMEISHTWVGDLIATVTSPDGTVIELFDQPGVPADDNGCRRNNMLVTLDDEATNTADDLENMCMQGQPYAIEGSFQPISPLAALNGEDTQGDWVLSIEDVFDADGGAIETWSLELCFVEDAGTAPDFSKIDLVIPSGGTGTIGSNNLMASSPTNSAAQISYILLTLPSEGTLTFNGTDALVGTAFTQEDINNNLISYTNTNLSATSDEFRFDIVTSDGGWIHNEPFNIVIGGNVLLANSVLTSGISCFDTNDGVVTVNVSGSNPPFEYSLNGVDFVSDNVFTGLSAGDYTFTIKDANGTIITTNTISLSNPVILSATAAVSSNSITVTASGGTGILMYSLDGMNFQDSNIFSDLDNGSYTITIQDANGCTTTVTATINIIVSAEVATTGVSCNNGDDGSLMITTVTGGVGPYMYSLDGNDFQSSNVFTGLLSGDYTIYVMDTNGNVFQDAVYTVSEPSAITATANVNMNNIIITASGGTGVLTYSIDGMNFQSSNEFTGLANDDYTITIQDANGCTTVISVTVNIILAAEATTTDLLCDNSDDGTLTITTVTGGESPYMYSLDGNDFQSSNEFTDLSSGDYTIYVMDANGNVFQGGTFTIMAPPVLTAIATVDMNSIVVTSTGGTGTLMYSIDGVNFQSSNEFTELPNGTYIVTVIDENGCTQSSNQVMINFTSLDELDFDIVFDLFPNPTTGDMTLILDQPTEVNLVLRIFDVTGKIAQEIRIEKTDNYLQQQIDVQRLPAGSYEVVLTDGELFGRKRFVKM